jgi:hypothetical protein
MLYESGAAIGGSRPQHAKSDAKETERFQRVTGGYLAQLVEKTGFSALASHSESDRRGSGPYKTSLLSGVGYADR